jgi:fatty acid desaturase
MGAHAALHRNRLRSRAAQHAGRRPGSRMNPRRVIALMTVAVFFVLTVVAVMFFGGGIPPWPLLLCFAISHGIFCLIIMRVKPYHGPYKEPMIEPDPSQGPSL